jgi:hypothetical protein
MSRKHFDDTAKPFASRISPASARTKDKAAHACRALCRARVAEELQRRRGTRIGEHLKMVLSIFDRQALS